MKYSKTTNSFYHPKSKFKNIPNDLVNISDEYHQELLDGQYKENKKIAPDEKGHPILIDIYNIDELSVIKKQREKDFQLCNKKKEIASLVDKQHTIIREYLLCNDSNKLEELNTIDKKINELENGWGEKTKQC